MELFDRESPTKQNFVHLKVKLNYTKSKVSKETVFEKIRKVFTAEDGVRFPNQELRNENGTGDQYDGSFFSFELITDLEKTDEQQIKQKIVSLLHYNQFLPRKYNENLVYQVIEKLSTENPDRMEPEQVTEFQILPLNQQTQQQPQSNLPILQDQSSQCQKIEQQQLSINSFAQQNIPQLENSFEQMQSKTFTIPLANQQINIQITSDNLILTLTNPQSGFHFSN